MKNLIAYTKLIIYLYNTTISSGLEDYQDH